MNFKNLNKNYLLLHVIVFIWGWSPILGKAISVEALQLVWYRILFTVIVLGIYFPSQKISLKATKKLLFTLFGIGIVIAIHWFCFYQAIKVSNVSVTLVAFSTGTLFTSITEPLFYRRRILWYEILFGLLIILAISIIFSIETQYLWGFVFGALAALTASLFTVWNGLLVRKHQPEVITFYELSGGLIFLTFYLLFTGGFSKTFFEVSSSDFFYLGVLSVVSTAFPFVASTKLLQKLSPFTITLTVNLETVYGIIFAFLLWPDSEKMTTSFYIGTVIILGVIVFNAVVKSKLKKEVNQ